MSASDQQPQPQLPGWTRRNWGLAAVLLLAVNIVVDLVLGRHGLTGVEVGVLVVLWLSFWALVITAVAASVVRLRRRTY